MPLGIEQGRNRPTLIPDAIDVLLPMTLGVDQKNPDWRDYAICAQTDPEIFFPEKGGSTREAKKVCNSCDVREACLDYALEHDEKFGIWGGLSERERRKLKKPKKRKNTTVKNPEVEVGDQPKQEDGDDSDRENVA